MYGVLSRILANAHITWQYSITTASNNNKLKLLQLIAWLGLSRTPQLKDVQNARKTK